MLISYEKICEDEELLVNYKKQRLILIINSGSKNNEVFIKLNIDGYKAGMTFPAIEYVP